MNFRLINAARLLADMAPKLNSECSPAVFASVRSMAKEVSKAIQDMGLQECLICNKEARDRMPDGARELTEELIADHPPDQLLGNPCWNCWGSGYTGMSQKEINRRISAWTRRMQVSQPPPPPGNEKFKKGG